MDTNLNSERPSWQPGRWRGARYGAWLGGLGLVLLGIIFLLNNFGIFAIGNWWALFILLPAAGAFLSAAAAYKEAGHLNAAARGSLVGGLLLTLVAAIFLLNLNWGVMWPVFIIIAGVGALLAAFTERK